MNKRELKLNMLNLKETELCLGLPGGNFETNSKVTGKRGFSETVDLKLNLIHQSSDGGDDDVEDLKEKVMMKKMNSAKETKDIPIKPPAKYISSLSLSVFSNHPFFN